MHAPGIDRVGALRLTPDARIAAALLDGRLVIWDFPDGQWYQLSTARQKGALTDLEVSADGRRALMMSHETAQVADGRRTRKVSRNTVQVWDLTTARCLWELPERRQVNAMALTADGRRAVLAMIGGPRRHEIQVWDIDHGRMTRSMTGPGWIVSTLALSPDGRYALAATDDDSRVRLWDLDQGRCLRTFPGHIGGGRDLLLHLGSHSAVSVDEDNARLMTWDSPGTFTAAPALGRPRRQADLDRHGRWSASLLAAAGRAIAAGRTPVALDLVKRARAVPGHERDARAMELWRVLGTTTVRTGLRSVRAVRTLGGLTTVFSVAIAADGRIACGAGSEAVHVWDTASGARLAEWKYDGAGGLGMGAEGGWVVASGSGVIVMRSVAEGSWPRLVDTDRRESRWGDRRGIGVTGVCSSASVSAAGHVLAACRDSELRMWDMTTGECVRTLPGEGVRTGAVWLSPDARQAVSAGDNGNLRVWDTGAGTCVVIQQPGAYVSSVCLSADGRFVLSAGRHDGWTLWLTDAVTGAFVRGFSEARDKEAEGADDDDSDVMCAARLSSDGRFAFSGDGAGGVHVWETATGRRIRTLEGHSEDTFGLALTPDDRFLLSGSSDGTVRLWELDWELATEDAEA
ncbi:hypothetical protein F0344_33775 [Streptomyces finlayi]|uniref:WD40 repeat domain-containing protein n=1 Tax=Streptomyces finlayi TaxID=67296 RepID=A0A7G7BU88_9ACTN|nr:hypothetical protein [Streptomyces finlayi]QNE78903.1 hypothetical protein F0344_33775 [Streptomyces finlayi]